MSASRAPLFQKAAQRDLNQLYPFYFSNEFFFVDISGPFPFLTRTEFIDEFEERRVWIWREQRKLRGYFYLYDIQPAHKLANFHLLLFEGHIARNPGLTEQIQTAVLAARDSLGLTRVQAVALALEKQRLDLLKAIGFKEEGLLRHHFFSNGRLHDLVMLALIDACRYG